MPRTLLYLVLALAAVVAACGDGPTQPKPECGRTVDGIKCRPRQTVTEHARAPPRSP